jgi:hypothetical protein
MPSRSVDPRFASRMRELLAERNVSFRTLATMTFHAKSYLHQISTGAKQPTVELARRIDDALDARGELVGYISEEVGDVRRRTMITALAALGLGQAADRIAVSDVLGMLAPDADEHTADDWREAVHEYGHSYTTAPRDRLLADLLADLAEVVAAASRARSSRTAAGLNESGAYLVALAAMVCTYLGYEREARLSWRAARRLGRLSGSDEAQLWIAGQVAILGPYAGRPLPFVLDLVDRGLAGAGRHRVAGVAKLHGARAQAYALLGRQREAVEAFAEVERVYDSLPDTATLASRSVFGWPEHRLRHTQSFVHTMAGGLGEAHRAQDRALALLSGQALSRSQLELHRAACMVRDGDVTAGIAHASLTLSALPGRARGVYVAMVADRVAAVVPAGERQRTDVRDYVRQVVAVRGGAA